MFSYERRACAKKRSRSELCFGVRLGRRTLMRRIRLHRDGRVLGGGWQLAEVVFRCHQLESSRLCAGSPCDHPGDTESAGELFSSNTDPCRQRGREHGDVFQDLNGSFSGLFFGGCGQRSIPDFRQGLLGVWRRRGDFVSYCRDRFDNALLRVLSARHALYLVAQRFIADGHLLRGALRLARLPRQLLPGSRPPRFVPRLEVDAS